MPNLPLNVQPGDIISSDLMTAILTRLAELSDVQPTGTQVVPNVFGTRLTDARSLITQPVRQLTLGFVIDISGASVDPLAAANLSLIVLNQNPVANSLVALNTPVNLVVSQASAGSGPPVVQPPTITQTETPTGTVTTNFAVSSTIVLVGTNYSATASENTVTFNNIAAIVSGDPANPTQRLFVTVPTGIPGAPVDAGDSDLTGVNLVVQTLSGTPAITTITLTAPVADQPAIVSVSPGSPFETTDITITGTNFTSTAEVLIRGQSATIVSNNPTQLVATVPNFADIPSDAIVNSSLVVSVPGVGEDTFKGIFRVRGA
jgi:hypothetical protein